MYGANHIYFLQHMIKAGCISLDTAITFCRKLTKDDQFTKKKLKNLITEINAKINAQKLHLLITTCEVTQEEKVVFITTANDDIAKLQENFTALELEYFQAIMHEIVTSDAKKLPKIFCMNLASSLSTRLQIKAAEVLLKRWTESGYLVGADGGFVCLGARSIAEYTSHFKTNCKDYVSACQLCSELVFIGSTCSHCNKLMHTECINTFLKKRNKCPHCKKEWGGTDEMNASAAETSAIEASVMSTDEEDLSQAQ